MPAATVGKCLRNKVPLLRSILPHTKSSNFPPKCEQQSSVFLPSTESQRPTRIPNSATERATCIMSFTGSLSNFIIDFNAFALLFACQSTFY